MADTSHSQEVSRSRHGFNLAFRRTAPTEEQERLLSDEEQQAADADGESCSSSQMAAQEQPCAPNPYAHLPVYTTIHRIRRDVIASVDDPYSLEQLKSPRMNISIVRPLVKQLYSMNDCSVVYCLLVNQLQFLREQHYAAHQQTVNLTRALLCELIAIKILRRTDEENPGRKGLLLLSNILVAGFDPFQQAPEEIVRDNSRAFRWAVQKRGGYERKLTALEVAIISESKLFLSMPACQKVVEAIYVGQVVYTPTSFIDILPDHYKHKPISLYDPRKAPVLNQYRLIVPRTRNILEVGQFMILLALYILVMAKRPAGKSTHFTIYELIFCIYTFGWVLDQVASILEHGWQVYTQNLWSFLDVTFSLIYTVYLVLRIRSYATGDGGMSHLALDILSTGAAVLVPRLAFNAMSENMLFVSLREMMANFAVLTVLAIWCFAGFLLAMTWLGDEAHRPVTISKWMLWVWFGLDGTGIQRSIEFHWLLGPVLMVTFAFLGNTLFLTILVSMLSNTFAVIVANATAEIQFRRAVLTFEGVKSDAIFAYQPPFNILALAILLPLKFLVSPRWFHKLNVTAVRIINAPLLLLIALLERRSLWRSSLDTTRNAPLSTTAHARHKPAFWDFARLSVHGDIQVVFDLEPPEGVIDELSGVSRPSSKVLEDAFRATDREASVAEEEARRRRVGLQRNLRRRQRSSSYEGSADSFLRVPAEHKSVLNRGQTQTQTQTQKQSQTLPEDANDDIKDRLKALEASNQRIEQLLLQMSQDLDPDPADDDDVVDSQPQLPQQQAQAPLNEPSVPDGTEAL
ncbi:MAG: hypothetical protein M1824_003590 [Vezdaea acicularis]|nr:MAG: hypothetical protein M1824_003590 [Vezdaea acicularis]